MALFKSKAKAAKTPVPGPELGVTNSKDWSTYIEDNVFKARSSIGTTGTWSLMWDEGTKTSTTTPITAGSVTFGPSTTVYPSSGVWGTVPLSIGMKKRISKRQMQQLAIELVQERYPDFDPSR